MCGPDKGPHIYYFFFLYRISEKCYNEEKIEVIPCIKQKC